MIMGLSQEAEIHYYVVCDADWPCQDACWYHHLVLRSFSAVKGKAEQKEAANAEGWNEYKRGRKRLWACPSHSVGLEPGP